MLWHSPFGLATNRYSIIFLLLNNFVHRVDSLGCFIMLLACTHYSALNYGGEASIVLPHFLLLHCSCLAYVTSSTFTTCKPGTCAISKRAVTLKTILMKGLNIKRYWRRMVLILPTLQPYWDFPSTVLGTANLNEAMKATISPNGWLNSVVLLAFLGLRLNYRGLQRLIPCVPDSG